MAKYGGVILLEEFDPAAAYALLTLTLNIYTDPQKPIQVSPGLYEIGSPNADSPLLVTTNFSLTYFSVSSEIEASGHPAWLLVADAEGLSVLTAWAVGVRRRDDRQGGQAVRRRGEGASSQDHLLGSSPVCLVRWKTSCRDGLCWSGPERRWTSPRT